MPREDRLCTMRDSSVGIASIVTEATGCASRVCIWPSAFFRPFGWAEKNLKKRAGATPSNGITRTFSISLADKLLRLSTEAETALKRGSLRSTLCIGTLESTAAARLPPLLSSYHERFPDVQIQVSAAVVNWRLGMLRSTSGHAPRRILRLPREYRC
ncbi:LysR substrate binding domain protein [compost metagenome]